MTAPRIEVINIGDHGVHLKDPFTMVDLAQIDDLSLSLFLCQGNMPMHRHLDQDELFLVHSGTISLDSEWGTVMLRAGELTVVPKSLGHRSSSLLRSLVLLIHPRLMVDRRNGHRRLFMPADENQHLEKINISAMGRQLMVPFQPVVLTHLDTFAVHLRLCEGAGGWEQLDRQATLILCCDGRLSVEVAASQVPAGQRAAGRLSVGPNELVVVPASVAHRLSSVGRAVVLGLTRHEQPGIAGHS